MCSGRVYDFNVFQILARMTGALWAKRGERDISRGTRRARVALRAKYRVRPA